jgi:hypothetical protein
MQNTNSYPLGCIISDSADIDSTASIGPGCIMHGKKIKICEGSRIDAGCVVGEGVTIGRNAWIRAGSVVLRSIPPNAVAEGNPAQVIGYQNVQMIQDGSSNVRLIDVHGMESATRPFKRSLGVGRAEVYLIRSITDARGSLAVGEVPTELPFLPSRFFIVHSVPSVELRGEHAHKKCEQFLMCINGSCRVMVDDGISRCEVILDRPDVGVYMPALIWGTQYRYSADAALLVFASHAYDPEDYIRTYDEFLGVVLNH